MKPTWNSSDWSCLFNLSPRNAKRLTPNHLAIHAAVGFTACGIRSLELTALAFKQALPKDGKLPVLVGPPSWLQIERDIVSDIQYRKVVDVAPDQRLPVLHLCWHALHSASTRQSYAKVPGSTGTIELGGLVEDALKANDGSFLKHKVEVVRDYEQLPPVTTDKHRVM